MHFRFFVVFISFLACAYLALAEQFTLEADFKETRPNDPYAYLTGTLYYLYDTTNASKCRLRLNYNVPSTGSQFQVISNLYNFEYKALYSMCGTTCTAESFSELPLPFWKCANYTKSNIQQDGLYWYNKTGIGKSLVASLLISDQTKPTESGYSLKAIVFSDDRYLKITSALKINKLTESAAVFKPNAGTTCPTPTCSMFTDIVFVLDDSGSVSSSEWRQSSDFVIKVLDSFKFGDNAAAAACLHFNGRVYTKVGKTRQVVCDPSKQWWQSGYYANRFYKQYEFVTEPESVSMLVPSTATVTTNKDDLVNFLKQDRVPEGGTCQGMGLELAMQVFDNSPRNNYTVPPNRIVIAVTDGDDYCPNRTIAAAEKLRNEYGAIFIGIGVGLECVYDKDFIANLTSKLAGQPAYFDAANGYSEIKKVADKLFAPICDEFHSECGPECKGFCGCGECWCPSCISTGDGCSDYRCSAQAGTSRGCEIKPVLTCAANSTCTEHYCYSNNGQGECRDIQLCDWLKDYNPGTCRTVVCNDGACSINRNHNFCSKFNTNCEIWECAAENETADDEESGCRVKTNKTADCIKNGKGGCFETTCDINDPEGKCIEKDTCINLYDSKCVDTVCEKNPATNVYQCKNYTTSHPSDTLCKTYACNDKSGWYIAFNRTAATCREEAKVKTCRTFKCLDDEGCVETFIEDCTAECDDKMAECVQNATDYSSIKECHVGFCKVRKNGNIDETYCLTNHTDCRESQAAAEARALNTAEPAEGQKRVCFTLTCTFGECGLVQIPMPEEDNACYEHICVEDEETGGWKWIVRTTSTYNTCKSDKCFTRTCVNETGCVPVDICVSKTTECETFTCEKDNNTGVVDCTSKNEVKGETELLPGECRYERCEAGKKVWVYPEVVKTCGYGDNDTNKCLVPICNTNGKCEYYKKPQPDDDPCKVYDCVPETGNYTFTPKCDDGLYCTENKCTIDGQCRFIPINCYSEVNMTNYPCFKAECVEQSSNYRCTRRLKTGVYIDVCGNCVRDGATDESSESSDTMTSCTTAPEEPLTKEGLAAASIAMIVLGAIIIGGAVAASSVVGTKALLEHAHAAEGQSAHTNPLFEDDDAEMTNPAFAGEQ